MKDWDAISKINVHILIRMELMIRAVGNDRNFWFAGICELCDLMEWK